MIVGCYTLHLYCEAEAHDGYMSDYGYHVKTSGKYKTVTHEFSGRNERECLQQARKIGWRITKDRRAFCPYCKE